MRVTPSEMLVLSGLAKLLRAGGTMVYATCSVESVENEQQIESFLAKHSDTFKLVKEKNIRPQEGYDGFYMALLERIA